MVFSAPIQDKSLKFMVKISLTNEYLFYNQFFHLPVSDSFAYYGRTHPCLTTQEFSNKNIKTDLTIRYFINVCNYKFINFLDTF